MKKNKENSQEETLTEDNFFLSKIMNKSSKSMEDGYRIQTTLNFSYYNQKLNVSQFFFE